MIGGLSQRFTLGFPPRCFAQVEKGQANLEEVLHLPDARVAWVDYNALRHDFPALADMPEAYIDAWLVSNAAYVSKPQAEQAVVNSPIKTDGACRRALRPPNYGRAVIVEVPGGLLDLKGAGVRPG